MNYLAQILQKGDVKLPNVAADEGAAQTMFSYAITVLGALCIVYVVYMAVKMSMSRGNAEEVAKARNGIIYGGIGLLVAIAAGIMVRYIAGWF